MALKVRATDVARNEGTFLVSDDPTDHQLDSLPAGIRDEVKKLIDDIRSVVPTDFELSVNFEFHGIRVSAELQDGNAGSMGMGGGGFFTSRKSMLRKLRTTNWNDLRTDALQQLAAFDEMVGEAEDRPADVPSSAEAAQQWETEISRAVTDTRKIQPVAAFTLIAVQSGQAGFEVSHHSSRDRLIGTIADCMTCQYDILAVLEVGLAWNFPEIESAKVRAVAGLGPISRAKAERRL